MLAELILKLFIAQGSKKAAYFFYSADLGGVLLIGLFFLFFGSAGFLGFLIFAGYILYFFNVGRKEADEDAGTFAINLLKWSVISVPFEIAMVALYFWIAFGSMS